MSQINLDWNWKDLERAFFDKRKYVTISAGRGTGKTRGAFLWLLEELYEPDVRSSVWVDTIQANLDSYVEEHLRGVILKDIWSYCHYNSQRKRLILPGDRFIQFVSAERPENAEGFRYHRMVLNEAGLILKKSSLWDNSFEPMTHPKDGVPNKTRLVGTMKGKNKFHELRSINDDEWKDYHFTVYDSPNYNLEDIEKIKRRVPEMVWRQEYLSEALDDAGTVFRNITSQIREPQNKEVDIIAIDLAKHEDFTVITCGNTKNKQVVEIDRFNQIDWTFQKNRIVNIWQRYNKPKIIIDSTGVGDPIFDDLRNAGINIEGYKFTSQSKAELIQGLSLALDNGDIWYPNIPELLHELQVFGYDITLNGNIRYNAPSGMHDDIVISLALFNYKVKTKSEFKLTWI